MGVAPTRLLIGGQERTQSEFTTLLHGAGFALTRVVTSVGPTSVLEARPV